MSQFVDVPRLRMFAGPNGSGKTTIQRDLAQRFGPTFLGVLVNPDELEAVIKTTGRLDLAPFSIQTDEPELRAAFTSSTFLQQQGLAVAAANLRCAGQCIDFSALVVNSYYASVLADFLRRKLLASLTSFSFETVMSEPSKIDLLREARALGFRTYLYFVATEAPEINVVRVALRVQQGGHGVPHDKILARYQRSLSFVCDALRETDRAYFFDTSEKTPLYVAESESGARPELRCEGVPNWFRTFVLDKFDQAAK